MSDLRDIEPVRVGRHTHLCDHCDDDLRRPGRGEGGEGVRSREERREEERKYQGDVEYEVWRHNGNTDAVNRDRVQDHYYNGDSTESAAADELRRQRPMPQEWPQDEEDEG